ncbi:MAG: hypothetical protein HXS48_18770 [Theionarchaea archaeon]|nr:MAG: hypothetical protein AYK19_09585 [Theionarchaea archaeon DG-70-1]MBU7028985.1 hypothetical protein [Theionarchaea archaeon]
MNLIKEMEKHLPIPAYPLEGLCKTLRKHGVKVNPQTELQITKVFDSGDTGGIICTILEEKGNVFVASLTHLRIKPDHPLHNTILMYQKKRIKRLSRKRYR